MDFSFFTTDNKSGHKTKETWFSKNHPDVYSEIVNYSLTIPFEMSFKEKIWFYFNKLTERPKCKTCGSEIKFRERFDKPYGDFCTLDCINNNKAEMVDRIKKSFKEKYDIEFFPQHPDFIKKQKQTKLIRYGDENYVNVEKNKQTRLLKYGDENYVNSEKRKETCLKKYGSTAYSNSNHFKEYSINKYKLLYPKLNIIKVEKDLVTVKCDKCGEELELFKYFIHGRYKRNISVCTKCQPFGISKRSSSEKELTEFLYSINVKYELNDRSLIGKELDIYIPSKSLAIEINGVYWHSELFVNDEYHLNKTHECNKKNIQLLHIFEDEWLFKKEIVQSIIKNKLGLFSNKIYSRKCTIKEVDSLIAKEFLETNHIEGKINSKVNIGLYDGNKLVSLMCFNYNGIYNPNRPIEWKLTRFANIIDTNVIGAANKLFQYFLKTYQPKTIISYSDLRLFNGNMYSTLGFKKIRASKPNYWYVKNGHRYHRFNFRKSILVKEGYDVNLTEREIMFERKYYRIYDCGNIRWEFTNK